MKKTCTTLEYLGRGGGNATIAEGNTNMLIKFQSGNNLLLDCGKTLEFEWKENRKGKPTDIKNFYISHCHDDHVQSLAWFGLFSYFFRGSTSEGKPNLYANERLIDDIWDAIKGQCRTLEGKIGKLDTFFNVIPLKQNAKFELEGYEFQTVQTHHIHDGYSLMPSYGLIVQRISDDVCKSYKKTFITTDTQFCPEQYMMKLYNECDEIHHDCEVGYRSGVHANYEDLCTLDISIKNKIWLNHYTNKAEDWEKQGFKGFVEKGQTFDL